MKKLLIILRYGIEGADLIYNIVDLVKDREVDKDDWVDFKIMINKVLQKHGMTKISW